jgi:hypothetical protein
LVWEMYVWSLTDSHVERAYATLYLYVSYRILCSWFWIICAISYSLLMSGSLIR